MNECYSCSLYCLHLEALSTEAGVVGLNSLLALTLAVDDNAVVADLTSLRAGAADLLARLAENLINIHE